MSLPHALRWSTLSLRTKGLIVVGLPVLPLAVFWALTAWTLAHRIGPAGTTRTHLAAQAAAARVVASLLDAESGARDYLFTDNPGARARYEAAIGRLDDELTSLEQALAVVGLGESFAPFQETADSEIHLLGRLVDGPSPDDPPIGDRVALDRSVEYIAALSAMADELQKRHAAATADEIFRGELSSALLLWGLLVGSTVCAGGGIAVAMIVASSVSRRVRILAKNADRLARGGTQHSPPPGEDEIGQLDRRFREAAHELRRREHELRQRSLELEAANRELEAFSYSVSHDLRAPLRVSVGFSEILETSSRRRLNATGRDALQRVRTAARRMDTLIDALIDLSRLTTGELKRQPVDLTRKSREIVDELSRHEGPSALDVDVEPNLTAEADPRLVRTALQNLIDNAVKYTARTPRPRIEIGSMPNGHARVFYVRDNGVGFSMQHAGRLFNPFQRLHSEGEFEGTGIGLAVVRRVVERHGGRVWAESSPGAGAAFFFTLEPALPDSAMLAHTAPCQPEPSSSP